MLGWRIGAKKERHQRDLDGTAEVHLIVELPEAFELGKKLRNRNLRGPVDDDAAGGRTDVVHDEHDRVLEIGIG